MIICGIKLTHDACVAVVENEKLKFSIEVEKLRNNSRYESIEDTAIIEDLLKQQGLNVTDIDTFVVDGWGGYNNEALAIQPRLTIKEDFNQLAASNSGEVYALNVAQYIERSLADDVLRARKFTGLKINRHVLDYESYLHVTGHIFSTYSTSPFPKREQSAYVLVWDGGMYPQLYFYDYIVGKVTNLGPLFLLIGNIYSIFSQHFGPFKVNSSFAKDSLSVAGKVMAFIAYGKFQAELLPIFD